MSSSLSIDAYIPAMPYIQKTFNVSNDLIGFVLTTYLVGTIIAMIFSGVISDKFGVENTILFMLALYSLSNFFSSISFSYQFLLISRCMEGLTSGGFVILVHALIRDHNEKIAARKIMSLIMTLFSLSPIAIPFISGWITINYGWRFISIIITVLEILILILAIKYMPNKNHLKKINNNSSIFSVYIEIFKKRDFIKKCSALSICTIGFMIYIGSAGALILNVFKLDAMSFSWIYTPLILGSIIGSLISTKLASSRLDKIIKHGYIIMFISSIMNLACSVYSNNILIYVIPIMTYSIGLAIITPPLIIDILSINPSNKGIASSIQFIIQTITLTITINVLSAWAGDSTIRISIIILFSVIISYVVSVYKKN